MTDRRIMYVVQLDTGHKFTYLPGLPMTASEAADAIRAKFPGRTGKFIRKECGRILGDDDARLPN